MLTPPLQTRGHIDSVTLYQRHDRALDIRLLSHGSLEGLDLAFANMSVDALDLDIEELLHRFLDLRLGGVPCDFEHDLVLLRGECRFLGDHRRKYEVIMARIGRAHFKRASSDSSAA